MVGRLIKERTENPNEDFSEIVKRASPFSEEDHED